MRIAEPVGAPQAVQSSKYATKAVSARLSKRPVSPAVNVDLSDEALARSRAAFVADGSEVVVDVLASSSGYDNKVYWSSDGWQTKNFVAVDDDVSSVSLGRFAAGTKIAFAIDNGDGGFFTTDERANAADGIDHARIERGARGTRIGFEDLLGGGDMDFDDAVIQVRNADAAEEAPALPDAGPVDPPPEPPVEPEVGPDPRIDDGGGDATDDITPHGGAGEEVLTSPPFYAAADPLGSSYLSLTSLGDALRAIGVASQASEADQGAEGVSDARLYEMLVALGPPEVLGAATPEVDLADVASRDERDPNETSEASEEDLSGASRLGA